MQQTASKEVIGIEWSMFLANYSHHLINHACVRFMLNGFSNMLLQAAGIPCVLQDVRDLTKCTSKGVGWGYICHGC